MSICKKILVAAIDIGTTHSGWAFSFKSEYESDPLRITSYNWPANFGNETRIKTSTCILFDKNKQFDSFGNDAEDKYSELAEKEEHQEWYFLKNFQTTLFNKKEQLPKAVMLNTADGREMVAIDVFSAAIKFLRGHLLNTLFKKVVGMSETEIQWVLTAPDIWDDTVKQFLREAAEKAGICGDQLLIVPEPEAVFLYFIHEKLEMDSSNCSPIRAGTKCMVVIAENIGVEVAVYDVQPSGILKKLYSAYNCDWGGSKVDTSFCNLLTDIVGNDVMKAFLSDYKDDFLQVMSNFEHKKRFIYPKQTKTFKIKIIRKTLEKAALEINPESDISTLIASNPKYNSKVTFIADKLLIDAQIAQALFDKSCSEIIYHLQELFLYPNLKDVSSILLVGSYAMSPMLKFALSEAFKHPQREIFVPHCAEVAALEGAVIYGHGKSPVE